MLNLIKRIKRIWQLGETPKGTNESNVDYVYRDSKGLHAHKMAQIIRMRDNVKEVLKNDN